MLAHYAELGKLPQKRNRQFRVYAKGAVLGESVDQELVLLSLDYSQLIASGLVGIVMQELWSYLKQTYTKPSNTTEIELAKTIQEQQRYQHEATNRLLDMLQENVNEKLPHIEENAHPYLKRIVKPLEQKRGLDLVIQLCSFQTGRRGLLY